MFRVAARFAAALCAPLAFITAAQVSAAAAPAGALVPLTGAQTIDAGTGHTCALTQAGAVKCWGMNWSGQLGDGSTLHRLTAVDVVGLSSNVRAISAGAIHTCALTTAGAVKCWGNNNGGVLGDGSTEEHSTPVDVVGLSGGVQAIGMGGGHSCALTIAGAVKCWGTNANGQLGDGSTTNRSVPVNVIGLSGGVKAIGVGGSHTCAVTTAGAVKCWGTNFNGQLGDGSTIHRPTPVDVVGLGSGVQTISAGGAGTCVVTDTGAAKCWGWNAHGQLGDGTTTSRMLPVDVSGLSGGVQAIGMAYYDTCAATAAGAAKCWGDNSSGQLGDGTQVARPTPVDVVGLSSGVHTISPGQDHTCALTAAGGRVKCWGGNPQGQLGDGSTTARFTPVDVLTEPPSDLIFENGFELP